MILISLLLTIGALEASQLKSDNDKKSILLSPKSRILQL